MHSNGVNFYKHGKKVIMPLPILTKESRKKGLERALLARKKRANIKNLLKKGEIDIATLFKDKNLFNECISKMKVMDIVGSQPGKGRVSAEKMLRELKISSSKRIGGLGKNQKKSFYKYFQIQMD